jgi:hypothetical protein
MRRLVCVGPKLGLRANILGNRAQTSVVGLSGHTSGPFHG